MEEELREALRPFAEHALSLERCSQGRELPDTCSMFGPERTGERPNLGDCRKAAELVYGKSWRENLD